MFALCVFRGVAYPVAAAAIVLRSQADEMRSTLTNIPLSFARRVLFALFVMAFVLTGIHGWQLLAFEDYLRDEPQGIVRALGRDATTDGYIKELLFVEGVPRESVRRPADTIRAALDSLPAEGAVVFVVPKDLPKYNVMFLTWKYLSLPRPAYYVPCDNPAVAGIEPDEKIAAVVSYLNEPVPSADVSLSPRAWQVLPKLKMARASEAGAWKPYCSR